MQNMVKLHLRETPVTVWYDKPGTPGWVESIRLESDAPALAVSPEEAADLIRDIMLDWTLSIEEHEFIRECPCGEPHIN